MSANVEGERTILNVSLLSTVLHVYFSLCRDESVWGTVTHEKKSKSVVGASGAAASD